MKNAIILTLFICACTFLLFFHFFFPPVALSGIFPEKNWRVASPESQGIEPDKLKSALDYLKQISGADGIRETLIIRNGVIVWKGDRVDRVHDIYSCTKSFTSTVLGLLIDSGRCKLETKAQDYLPSLKRYYPNLKLKHFTTLTSGYESFNRRSPFDPDYPLFESGTKFHYGDASMNQFANVLTQIANEPIENLFKRRIADPIGMDPDKWYWGDFGKVKGIKVNGGSGSQSKGMHISALDFARFGLLFLNKGKWKGKQLIGAGWVKSATSNQVSKNIVPYNKKAWYRSLIGAYGFNWWVNGIRKDGKRRWQNAPSNTAAAQGNYNNYCFIVPEWNMVIVRMGTDKRINNNLYDIFFQKLQTAINEKR